MKPHFKLKLGSTHLDYARHARSTKQGCGVVRRRRFLGRVGFLITLTVGVGFFVRHRLRKYNRIIFYITFLNWEFLLKWYNFF